LIVRFFHRQMHYIYLHTYIILCVHKVWRPWSLQASLRAFRGFSKLGVKWLPEGVTGRVARSCQYCSSLQGIIQQLLDCIHHHRTWKYYALIRRYSAKKALVSFNKHVISPGMTWATEQKVRSFPTTHSTSPHYHYY